LRMCDDEVHARAQGQVSDVTWHEWLKAMHTQIRRPPVKQVWASVLRETPEDAYADLRRALADDGNGGYKDTDPCHWRRFTRYWRGLSHTPILLWGAKGRPRGPMRRPENHDKDHWQP
jgi:hypothetical protein